MTTNLSLIYTHAALADASHFADQIERPAAPGGWASQPTIRHEHHHWGSPGWYYPQPVYCGPSSPQPEKKDYSWVAIPAAIVGLGTMYFIGQNHAEWSQASAKIGKLRQNGRVVNAELASAPPAAKNAVRAVFEIQMAILEKIRSDAAKGLFLKGILVASVILAGIGGLASGSVLFAASLEPLLAYGAISTFLTSCAMLYRAGFSSMNNEIREEARELRLASAQAAIALRTIS